MKKKLSVLMAIVLVLGMFFSTAVITSAVTYKAGDVNMDGKINTLDVRFLMRAIVENTVLTAQQKSLGDMNGDGKVDTTDAHQIMILLMSGDSDMTTIDLLAPTADSWYNPVQTSSGTPSLVAETAVSGGGYTFKNVGGTWPYALYIYEGKILLPMDAVITYDLTVSCTSTSINLFTAGNTPDMNGDANNDGDDAASEFVKLNSLISSTNIDAGSGDLTAGTYTGIIKVSDLAAIADASAVTDTMLWVSGIKIYAVGANAGQVVIRKLSVTGYDESRSVVTSTDPQTAVRSTLINTAETAGLSELTAMRLYQTGALSTTSSINNYTDNKKFYDTELNRRVVNYADGYQMDVMLDWEPDYTLAAQRTRYSSDSFLLTVSKENKSPYGNTQSGWNTYLSEWVARYIGDSSFLSANNLSYTRTSGQSTSLLSGYTVINYDVRINNASSIKMPYYSIAIVRQNSTYNNFYLFVLKSTVQADSVMDRIVRSFKEVSAIGTATNSQGAYACKASSTWNAQTKAYFNKLQTQTTVDWGFFSASMVPASDSTYSSQRSTISSEKERLSTALNYDYEIMPTYTHLSYNGKASSFPTDMANEFAGGNGFNGKPVLQFTYQFTTQNNTGLDGYSPMFDILRGNYDTQFHTLAKQIKAYGNPVLFRLNNEMNTDWTSYCGMVTLLDPDIFVETWQRMYDIFEQEGVDNCIWIFNPIAKTTPYCNWGEYLSFMPGEDYVQILGLTSYEMGNSNSMTSFQSAYTALYNKSSPYFSNYPWVISEFACGSGGEKSYSYETNAWSDTTLGRNASQQAQWIQAMFTCLKNSQYNSYYAFCKNIKGAVWFSVNDYATVNNRSYVTNYLKLDSTLTQSLAQFKLGLASTQ